MLQSLSQFLQGDVPTGPVSHREGRLKWSLLPSADVPQITLSWEATQEAKEAFDAGQSCLRWTASVHHEAALCIIIKNPVQLLALTPQTRASANPVWLGAVHVARTAAAHSTLVRSQEWSRLVRSFLDDIPADSRLLFSEWSVLDHPDTTSAFMSVLEEWRRTCCGPPMPHMTMDVPWGQYSDVHTWRRYLQDLEACIDKLPLSDVSARLLIDSVAVCASDCVVLPLASLLPDDSRSLRQWVECIRAVWRGSCQSPEQTACLVLVSVCRLLRCTTESGLMSRLYDLLATFYGTEGVVQVQPAFSSLMSTFGRKTNKDWCRFLHTTWRAWLAPSRSLAPPFRLLPAGNIDFMISKKTRTLVAMLRREFALSHEVQCVVVCCSDGRRFAVYRTVWDTVQSVWTAMHLAHCSGVSK